MEMQFQIAHALETSNRTTMELKHQRVNDDGTIDRLLIEPLWN